MTVFSLWCKYIFTVVVFISTPCSPSWPKKNRFAFTSGKFTTSLMFVDDTEPSFFKQKSLIFLTLLAKRWSLFVYSILVKDPAKQTTNTNCSEIRYCDNALWDVKMKTCFFAVYFWQWQQNCSVELKLGKK